MHEFHLMTQVVKAVETGLQGAAQGKPLLVRLKIQAQSHLLTHDHATLETAFAVASRGTKAEGAKLEIIPVSGDAWCSHCKTDVVAIGSDGACATCGGQVLTGLAAPEVLVHELVVEE
jgi:hydrogenase nickel incorporation protein HypA/HybF